MCIYIVYVTYITYTLGTCVCARATLNFPTSFARRVGTGGVAADAVTVYISYGGSMRWGAYKKMMMVVVRYNTHTHKHILNTQYKYIQTKIKQYMYILEENQYRHVRTQRSSRTLAHKG